MKLEFFKNIPKNILLISFISIILIIIAIVYISKNDERYISATKSDNPESLISPIESKKNENNEGYENYFKRISSEPVTRMEKIVYNWQDVFDVFASNTQNSYLRYTISSPTLEGLDKEVKRVQPEFYKGSSDEILEEYGDVIKGEAKYYKLDWRLILAMIKQESAFTSTAVSRAGAYGFMQIMPKTGSNLEQTLNLENHTSPINNLIAGIYYYALLVGRYDQAGENNKYKLALAAYNAGSGHIEDAMTIAYYNKQNYLDWDVVAENLKRLGPEYDTLHTKIWNSKPPNGQFTNWKEPVNYVSNITFFWTEYKKIYKP